MKRALKIFIIAIFIYYCFWGIFLHIGLHYVGIEKFTGKQADFRFYRPATHYLIFRPFLNVPIFEIRVPVIESDKEKS